MATTKSTPPEFTTPELLPEPEAKEYAIKPGQALSYGNKLYFEGDRVVLAVGEEVGLEEVIEVAEGIRNEIA